MLKLEVDAQSTECKQDECYLWICQRNQQTLSEGGDKVDYLLVGGVQHYLVAIESLDRPTIKL